MNRIEISIIIGLFTWAMSLPTVWSYSDAESNSESSDSELINKCPFVAILYVCGDKISSQQFANKVLPSIEKKFEERRTATTAIRAYDFAGELDMLRAVIRDDNKFVQNYMDNKYFAPDIELEGFKFGLNEQLRIYERSLALIAAEPLYGPSSRAYLTQGDNVAAMLYVAGQKDRAKSLAKELLPLLERLQLEEKTSIYSAWYKYKPEEEVMLKGILSDDKDAVAKYMVGQTYIKDSLGARLEEAYGRIYLYKRLYKDLALEDRLPYAYKNLGWVQAIAGNYDESERAYKTALQLAQNRYSRNYPEILRGVRSEYAAMLKLAGKADEAAKLAKGLTPFNSSLAPTSGPPSWGP